MFGVQGQTWTSCYVEPPTLPLCQLADLVVDVPAIAQPGVSKDAVVQGWKILITSQMQDGEIGESSYHSLSGSQSHVRIYDASKLVFVCIPTTSTCEYLFLEKPLATEVMECDPHPTASPNVIPNRAHADRKKEQVALVKAINGLREVFFDKLIGGIEAKRT